MIILGIDPGTNILGYALLEAQKDTKRLIDMGVIKIKKYETHSLKLREIYFQVQEIIENYNPTEMAIEAPFYGKNPQSMLKLGRAQGVAMAAGITMGLNICEYAPKKIKKAVTGRGTASKEQVRDLLKQILKIEIHDSYLDATDALATALCHHIQLSSPLASMSKGKGWGSFIKNNPGRIVR